MNCKRSLLVIDTPNSCDRCSLNQQRDLHNDYYNELHICMGNRDIFYKERYADSNDNVEFNVKDIDFYNQTHPQCPLIQIDIKGLELAVECLEGYRLTGRGDNSLNTIKNLITKLGGTK